MFLLTRPWTSQDRSYVIGRKWTCAIKWISAVSEAELCRIFLLRGAHWNSMGTLVIRPGARWRRSVTLLQFSIYFYLTGNKFVFIKCISLSPVCSTERSSNTPWDTRIAQRQCRVNSLKDKGLPLNNSSFYMKAQTSQIQWPSSGQCVCLWDVIY